MTSYRLQAGARKQNHEGGSGSKYCECDSIESGGRCIVPSLVNKLRRHIRVFWLTQNSIRCLRPSDIVQNGATPTPWRGDQMLNKVVIVVFFKNKYSRSFITLRWNHWWQMDYFDDVFHTFLGLDSVTYLAVNGKSQASLFSSKIS